VPVPVPEKVDPGEFGLSIVEEVCSIA
jgi:hypothetical protein